ncbi:FeoA family protein [Segnochrobactraceae bacterium EtOH-i3]
MKRLPLFDIRSGTVRVAALTGGPAEEKRLGDLGLHVGSRVEVLQHSGANGLVISVNEDGRLVLDPATARGVLVMRLEEMLPALKLSDLKPGDHGRVTGIGKGALDYRQRLMSMGLTPGVSFEITRVAPLGDPVEIRVRGFAMSLRRDEAALLKVEKLA